MLKPAYKLTIGEAGGGGDRVIDTTSEPQASTVIDLTVTLDMDTPADSLLLLMGQVGTFRPERDVTIQVELGYDDKALEPVLSGTIVSVEPGLTTRRVLAYCGSHQLMRSFRDETYESMSAADIVKKLAEAAEIEVERAEDGIQFPAYVIDGRRSFYQHMHDLADLCGFDLYFNPDGRLIFEKFAGGRTVHVFQYGVHMIEVDVYYAPARAGEVYAWGESPGGQADDDWAWLTKDFSGLRGSAGSGQPRLALENPTLRTRQAARTAAEALERRIARRAIRGRLLVQGHPDVRLGDAMQLKDVPETALNDIYQVRGVTHRISKRSGFTTTIDFRSKASGAAL